MFTITEIKDHLTGMGHGSTLNKVRNIEAMFERSAAKLVRQARPPETIRTAALAQVIHDDLNRYPLPDDFDAIIDLIPQDNRGIDSARRVGARPFDTRKLLTNKEISIEGNEGEKSLFVNWKSRAAKVLHSMDSTTANGTWSAVATAANIQANTIFKKTGNASIEFDVLASGDGIQNTTISALDLTNEDEVADIFVWLYLGTTTNFTSASIRWGNDLTANYWASTAQTTQADGSAMKAGWNLMKFSWSTASETGTVTPSTIDSFQITIASTGAISNVRVDNIIFSIGRNFDIKYYSKYLFKNSSGSYISRPTSDDDNVTIDNDSLPLFLFECLRDMAQQMEGTDSAFDITFAEKELARLYPSFRVEHPNQAKKMVGIRGRRVRFGI